MAFAIISIFSLVVFSMLFNIGRMAIHYLVKVFNLTIFAMLFLLITSYATWPEETHAVVSSALRALVAFVRMMASE